MGHRVLVIDDQVSVAEILREFLTGVGYQVNTASGGHEGLRMFEATHFDVVITDVRMGDLDGLAVARHIRNSAKPGTPVIGISGTPWLLDDDKFDSVLSKPFSLKSLSQTMEALEPRISQDLSRGEMLRAS
ncbi:MAG: response regulator [Desulfobacterales bacterium]|nr:response regulator [Desulfobacterales bacterium]